MNPFPFISKATLGTFGFFGRSVLRIFGSKLLFGGVLSLIFFSVIFLDAIQSAMRENNFWIFFIKIGSIIGNADIRVKELVGGLLVGEGGLIIWLTLLGEIWFMFIFFRIYMMILKHIVGDAVATVIRAFLVLLFMAGFQIIYTSITEGVMHIPFSGMTLLLKNLFVLVNFGNILERIQKFAFIDKFT